MRRLALLVVLLSLSTFAVAQEQQLGKLHCDKPTDQHQVQVPGQEKHVFIVEQGKCTWTDGGQVGNSKYKDFASANFVEVTGNRSQQMVYGVNTTDDGDKAFVRVRGHSTGEKTGEGTWFYAGGTGKLKGIKGHGTYKSSQNDDGTADVVVTQASPEPAAK